MFLGTPADNMRDKMQKGRHVVKHGESNIRAKITERQVKEILDRLNKGEKQRVVATIYGVSQSTVSAIKQGVNWKHMPPDAITLRSRKNRGQSCTLTQDSVEEIKRQLHAGIKQVDIARQFKMSKSAISCIKLGKTWKHIKAPS
jgi:predicted XRE-type DNA-binding protein